MKRKVIKQGNGTLTITLPKQWTKETGLKGGSEIEVIEHEKSLIIQCQACQDKKEINIDVTGLDRTTILLIIQSVYRYGYDTIKIKSEDSSVHHFRTEKKQNLSKLIYESVNRLIGFEIMSSSENKYEIKRIASETIEDFESVLRRIFLLLDEMMITFIQGIKNDKELIRSIEFKHINLKKFINFCIRLLNKYSYKSSGKTHLYFNIISFLSKTEDIIKNNARYIEKYKIKISSDSAIDLLNDINESIRLLYDLFYKYDVFKISNLNRKRDLFREKLFKSIKNIKKEENMIIGNMAQIIELILDMTETRIAMEDTK